jgi:arginase
MRSQAFKSISLIVSPFHCGARAIGPGAGPLFLQTQGLLPTLQQFGLPVHEFEIEPVDHLDGELAKSFEVIRRTSKLVSQARDKQSFPIILSGNCSGAVGVAAGLTSKTMTGKELACVWFDAHDDFHTPDTIASGYGDSMPIAIMAGLCYKKLLQSVPGHQPLDLNNLVHVGMRDVTEEEKQRVIDAGFDIIWGSTEHKVDFGSALDGVLRGKLLKDAMVHVDLDSLDASIGMANKMATFGGLLEEDLVECLTRVVERTNPVSLTLASFDPAYEGADKIARVGIEGVKVFLRALLGPV